MSMDSKAPPNMYMLVNITIITSSAGVQITPKTVGVDGQLTGANYCGHDKPAPAQVSQDQSTQLATHSFNRPYSVL